MGYGAKRRACPVSERSHRSALGTAAVNEAGPVPLNLSASRANLYTVVFISPKHVRVDIQTFK